MGQAGAVVQQETIAVAADGKGRIEHFGIGQGLLHAVTDGKSGLLGLDNGDRDVRAGIQHVIGALGAAFGFRVADARGELATDHHPAVGEFHLFTKLVLLPAGLLNGGGDELGADVTFT